MTDLHNFTLEELKSEFKFTMLDVLALRKTKQNKRARTNTSDDPSDASSEDDSSEDPDDTASSKKKSKNLGGGVFAQLMDSCVRELLPSRWDGMEALGLRSAVVALAPQLASAHIHLRAEVDFLLDLIVAMKTPEEDQMKLLIWAHLMQQIQKVNYPQHAMLVMENWQNCLTKLTALDSELDLLKLVTRTKAELEKKKDQTGSATRSTTRPTTRPTRWGYFRSNHSNNSNFPHHATFKKK